MVYGRLLLNVIAMLEGLLSGVRIWKPEISHFWAIGPSVSVSQKNRCIQITRRQPTSFSHSALNRTDKETRKWTANEVLYTCL